MPYTPILVSFLTIKSNVFTELLGELSPKPSRAYKNPAYKDTCEVE